MWIRWRYVRWSAMCLRGTWAKLTHGIDEESKCDSTLQKESMRPDNRTLADFSGMKRDYISAFLPVLFCSICSEHSLGEFTYNKQRIYMKV